MSMCIHTISAEHTSPYLNKNSAKSFCVFFCVVFFFFVFYFFKISKFTLPGVMLMYERTSKDRKCVVHNHNWFSLHR